MLSTSLFFNKLKLAFQLTEDLAKILTEENLQAKIPNLKSNKIGEQFWCIIGARESFLKAIKVSEWKGFSCSVKNSFSIQEIITKLKDTNIVLDKLPSNFNEQQSNLLIDLYTHEIQHHGQLIRYCYALEIKFPKSWNEKYTV